MAFITNSNEKYIMYIVFLLHKRDLHLIYFPSIWIKMSRDLLVHFYVEKCITSNGTFTAENKSQLIVDIAKPAFK